MDIVDYLPSILLVGARNLVRSLVSTSKWTDIGVDSMALVVIDPLKRFCKIKYMGSCACAGVIAPSESAIRLRCPLIEQLALKLRGTSIAWL